MTISSNAITLPTESLGTDHYQLQYIHKILQLSIVEIQN